MWLMPETMAMKKLPMALMTELMHEPMAEMMFPLSEVVQRRGNKRSAPRTRAEEESAVTGLHCVGLIEEVGR
jgi:hypothetical protein